MGWFNLKPNLLILRPLEVNAILSLLKITKQSIEIKLIKGRSMRSQAGFTLLELLITLSILAILVGVGMPSVVSLSQNNTLVSQTNNVVGTIRFARREAVKRNTDVVICQSSDGMTCTNGADWTKGWIVFSDLNDNGVFDAPANANAIDFRLDDQLIRIQDGMEVDYKISSGVYGAAQPLSFNSSGYLDNSGDIALCDERGEDFCRIIFVELSGRTRTKTVGEKVCSV